VKSTSDKEKLKGLSLSRMGKIMAAAFTLIAGLLLVSSFITLGKNKAIVDDVNTYMSVQKIISQLQAVADDLTFNARSFTVKGETKYVDNYLKDNYDMQRLPNAIEEIQSEVGDGELSQRLERAKLFSRTIAKKECLAIRLVIDAKGYFLGVYPDAIKNTEPSDEQSELSAEEKITLAKDMLLDEFYEDDKKQMLNEIEVCKKLIAEQTASSLNDSIKVLNSFLALQISLVIVMVVYVIFTIIFVSRQVVHPLRTAARNISKEQALVVKGVTEYLLLAEAYNKMYYIEQEQKDQLKHEATHDNMTGLVNRTGFKEVCRTLDFSKAAIVMIDVDNFKTVNDIFGHDIGDKTLISIGNELRHNFRHGDIVCRFGGDEFLVLMTSAADTEESRAIIREKVDRINEALGGLEDGKLNISISCGVAFGTLGDDAESLIKQADKALYVVKNSGKQNVSFYRK